MPNFKPVTLGIISFVLFGISSSVAYFGLTSTEVLTLTLDHPAFRDNRIPGVSRTFSPSKLCEMMKLYRKQKKMCRRGRGTAHVLMEAIHTSVLECQYQFQHERWNCSIDEPYRQNMLKKGYKETSFLYAVSSASLVHTFARGCRSGQIDRCTCDESKHLNNVEAWKWGGCGDNIKFALKFTRRFLRRAKTRGKDVAAKVNQHNSRVGIKVVKSHVETKCKCHGVSGTCTVKTCWRQLAPFHEIGQVLKRKYDQAYKVDTNTNNANGKFSLSIRRDESTVDPKNSTPRSVDMVYIESSPSFCSKSSFSKGTTGRECNKNSTCHSLCCGRGYNVMTRKTYERCQCQVVWCCKFNCKRCLTDQEVYTCK
ncbi:protein Wnt-9a-like [Saccostrea cucullata]|uniref:protein Wnt-9a-like n=1 Tax=Saccostrea cuccullata TaxID=36930 RepID=UPI002ED659A7